MLHYDCQHGLSDMGKVVVQTVKALTARCRDFDSIAVQGTSGLMIGAPVALILGKPLVIIREDRDMRCHHNKRVENAENMGRRVLFLDDQISTGATLKHVQSQVAHRDALVTGTYMYQYDRHDAWAIDDQYDYAGSRW